MKSKMLSNILINKYFISGLLIIMCSFADVQAATVTVKVKSGSSPLSGADVCLGDSSSKNKYGYKITDNQGKAVFDNIPATQVKAIVSKTGYNGAQSTFSSSSDLFVPFNLATGDQGPICTKSSRTYSTVNRPISKSTAIQKKEAGTSSPGSTKELPSGTLEPIKPISDTRPTVCTWKSGSLDFYSLSRYVTDNGFRFEKTSEEYGSECDYNFDRVKLIITWGRDDVGGLVVGSKCDFRFFGGKKLQPGWKIKRFSSNINNLGCLNASANFTKSPSIGSNDLEAMVHIWSDPGRKCSMQINEIQLEGPSGKQCWEPFGSDHN